MFSGNKGAGYQASGTSIAQPSTMAQANEGYDQTKDALSQQQALLNQIQAQNGLTNQSDVYKQMQGVAAGTGPNPAQAQLNQATAQNVAQQGALMGSQRGTGANSGLMARQIAQNGAGIQQQAAGQAATLEANQRLGALNQLGGIANSQVANQIGTTNELNNNINAARNTTLNGIQGQNNANVGMQSNINSSNAAIAGANAKGQQGMLGGLMNGAGALPGLMKGIGGGAGGGAMATGADVSGGAGALDAIAPVVEAGAMVAYAGGKIPPKMAAGGSISGPSSSYGQSLTDNLAASNNFLQNPTEMPAMARGGKVPVIVSPGEAYVPPQNVKAVGTGKVPMNKAAEIIPGKAKVHGDSLKNDIVPKKLEEGGVVIPRSVMNSKDPAKNAAKFVSQYMAKGGMVGMNKARK